MKKRDLKNSYSINTVRIIHLQNVKCSYKSQSNIIHIQANNRAGLRYYRLRGTNHNWKWNRPRIRVFVSYHSLLRLTVYDVIPCIIWSTVRIKPWKLIYSLASISLRDIAVWPEAQRKTVSIKASILEVEMGGGGGGGGCRLPRAPRIPAMNRSSPSRMAMSYKQKRESFRRKLSEESKKRVQGPGYWTNYSISQWDHSYRMISNQVYTRYVLFCIFVCQ